MRSETDHDADLLYGEFCVFEQLYSLFQSADEDEFIRADADGCLHFLEQAGHTDACLFRKLINIECLIVQVLLYILIHNLYYLQIAFPQKLPV